MRIGPEKRFKENWKNKHGVEWDGEKSYKENLSLAAKPGAEYAGQDDEMELEEVQDVKAASNSNKMSSTEKSVVRTASNSKEMLAAGKSTMKSTMEAASIKNEENIVVTKQGDSQKYLSKGSCIKWLQNECSDLTYNRQREIYIELYTEKL